jgi:hypothetical protein
MEKLQEKDKRGKICASAEQIDFPNPFFVALYT